MDKERVRRAGPEKGKTGAAAEGQLAEQVDIDNVAATSRESANRDDQHQDQKDDEKSGEQKDCRHKLN